LNRLCKKKNIILIVFCMKGCMLLFLLTVIYFCAVYVVKSSLELVLYLLFWHADFKQNWSYIILIMRKWFPYSNMTSFFRFVNKRASYLLPTLKGNNSCEMYNFRIKVGNVQMFYSLNCLTCVMVRMMASNMVVCELKPLLGQTERLWNWYLLLLNINKTTCEFSIWYEIIIWFLTRFKYLLIF
jgi:hypothetical protein